MDEWPKYLPVHEASNLDGRYMVMKSAEDIEEYTRLIHEYLRTRQDLCVFESRHTPNEFDAQIEAVTRSVR